MRWVAVTVWLSACCLPCGGEPKVFSTGGTTAALSGRATLKGKVVPVYDVSLGAPVTQHVVDGGFTFEGLPLGHYDVVVHTADHHQGRETRFQIEALAPGTAVSDVEVKLGGGTWVHGRVLDADGALLAGAHVEAVSLSVGGCRDCVVSPLTHEAVTDAQGRYTLDGLDSPSGYAIHASAAGLVDNEQPVPGSDEVTERALDLQLSAHVDGGEPAGPFVGTSLRGVWVPEEDALLISVDGVEVQPLGRFAATERIHVGSQLRLETADGQRRTLRVK